MDAQKVEWKIRCVIYDCDGVLFDSIEANMKLYNDLCALVGRVPLKAEEIKYVHTHTVYEAIHFIFGEENGLEKKGLRIIKTDRFERVYCILKDGTLPPSNPESIKGQRDYQSHQYE